MFSIHTGGGKISTAPYVADIFLKPVTCLHSWPLLSASFRLLLVVCIEPLVSFRYLNRFCKPSNLSGWDCASDVGTLGHAWVFYRIASRFVVYRPKLCTCHAHVVHTLIAFSCTWCVYAFISSATCFVGFRTVTTTTVVPSFTAKQSVSFTFSAYPVQQNACRDTQHSPPLCSVLLFLFWAKGVIHDFHGNHFAHMESVRVKWTGPRRGTHLCSVGRRAFDGLPWCCMHISQSVACSSLTLGYPNPNIWRTTEGGSSAPKCSSSPCQRKKQ